MMKSYTLENWDGRLSNPEPLDTQNSTQGPSSIWDSRSHVLAKQSEKVKATNDISTAITESIHHNNVTNYSEAAISSSSTNDGSNTGRKARVFGLADYENTTENMSPANRMKPTPPDEAINASNRSQKTSRIFVPVENSLLHAFHAHVAPTSPALAKKLEATLFRLPSPTPKRDIEVISLHSTDAEGDDDDEVEVIDIQRLLVSPTKVNTEPENRVPSPAYSGHNSLFSPSPSERIGSSGPLFTPEPPSAKPPPVVKRQVALYVDVPPLRGPISAYKWMSHPTKKARSHKPPPVTYHGTLEDAYLALAENSKFCDVRSATKKAKKKKKPEELESKPPQNAIASSSKHPIVIDLTSNVESSSFVSKLKIKKRVHKDDGPYQNPAKKQKRGHTRVDIDLTTPDGGNSVAESTPQPVPIMPQPKVGISKSVITDEKENTGPTVLNVKMVKPIAFEMWDFNIRHLRNWIKQQRHSNSFSPSATDGSPSRRRTGSLNRETPWFYRIPAQPLLDEEEISVGGKIPTSWDMDGGYTDDSDEDEFEIAQSHPEQQEYSPKIDLAAQYRKKEKEKSSKGKTVAKPQSHGAYKSISPSSSTDSTQQSQPTQSLTQLVKDALGTVPQPGQSSQLDEALGPSTPSAKALGKRKAIDNEPYEADRPFRTFGLLSSHHDATSQFQSNVSNTNAGSAHGAFRKSNSDDIFIHNYVRSPSPILQPGSSSTAVPASLDNNGQILSTLYALSDGLDHDKAPFASTFDGTEPELGYPWDLGVPPQNEYQYETIDPSLLVESSVIEPEAPEISEPLLEYADDFPPSDDDNGDVGTQSTAPVAGPSGVQARSASSSNIVFPSSSSENTPDREYEPPQAASIYQYLKKRKRHVSISSDSSDSDDDTPLADVLAVKSREKPTSSASVVPDNDLERPAKRKKRRASSSSLNASDALPDIVYVSSNGRHISKGKVKAVDKALADEECAPSMKTSLPRIALPKRKSRRASSTSFHDVDHDHGLARNEHAPSPTPAADVGVKDGLQENEVKLDKETVRILPKRQRTQRKLQDFVEVDEFLRKEGFGDGLPLPPKAEVAPKPARKERGDPLSSKDRYRQENENWPREEVSLYCHQCRNRTSILKMVCPACDSKFCLRCLTTRYPDELFYDGIEIVWADNCPRCLEFCNCTACCKKRGETYVSSRKRPPGNRPLPSSPPPDILPHYTLPASHTAQPRHATPPDLTQNAQYFATMYDLNGKRVGATYTSVDAFSNIGVVPALPSIPVTKKAHIFVGAVQRSWGISKRSVAKYLHSLPALKQTKRAKKKSKEQRKLRHFVGSDTFALYRPEPKPYDPFGDLSSLSSLSSSEDEGEEPEADVETFGPPNLSNDDLSFAISLGLQACGVVRIDATGPVHTFTSV
ncbi:hypothetical protein JR316_0011332 [Psilocybe cubensis]|uniref:Zinc-finger domain-containing protein n=2 Tax=Psilocybe cubensis TaxID=181762 RepID=A0A8H7XUB1_PSICU|nr:hypothetical protein JR316_0011332 [Psilocybe cubensis]KAH9475773.1 hypothetical protein JR316_0011332 [Psilocybe cubensis]